MEEPLLTLSQAGFPQSSLSPTQLGAPHHSLTTHWSSSPAQHHVPFAGRPTYLCYLVSHAYKGILNFPWSYLLRTDTALAAFLPQESRTSLQVRILPTPKCLLWCLSISHTPRQDLTVTHCVALTGTQNSSAHT